MHEYKILMSTIAKLRGGWKPISVREGTEALTDMRSLNRRREQAAAGAQSGQQAVCSQGADGAR